MAQARYELSMERMKEAGSPYHRGRWRACVKAGTWAISRCTETMAESPDQTMRGVSAHWNGRRGPLTKRLSALSAGSLQFSRCVQNQVKRDRERVAFSW